MTKFSCRLVFCALLFSAVLLSINLYAQSTIEKLSEKKLDKNTDCNISADTSEYKLDSDWGVLSGNVVIEYGNIKLHADKVRFNRVSGDAEAEGNVVFISDTGDVWRGDTLNVNVFEGLAVSSSFDFYSDPVRVIADKGSVYSDENSNKEYVVDNAIVTTCTNAPGHFHYYVKAKSLSVKPDDELVAQGAVSYLFGIPIFYWPYYWKDLNRHYGFRFEPGYGSDWGFFLLTSYKFPVYQNKKKDINLDSKTSLDLRSDRGVAFGEKLEWNVSENFDGWFSAYYLHDNGRPKNVEDKDRYRFRFENEWEVTDRDRILAQALYVSDDRVMEDFFEEEHDQMNQPDTYLAWTHRGDFYSGGLFTHVRLNDFYTQTERLPEFWYNLNGMELFNTGFYLKNNSSISYLNRVFDERTWKGRRPDPAYDVFRMDTDFVITKPFKVMDFLSVVPRVGYQATFYNKTLPNNSLETKEDSEFRNIFELGTEMSFKASSTWQDNDGFSWRHVIEPYADFVFIPEASVLPNELFQFDEIDKIDEGTSLKIGLKNRWQYKSNVQNSSPLELLYIDLYAVFNLDAEENEDTFETLNLDLRFKPISWMQLSTECVYEERISEVSEALFKLSVWYDDFKVDAMYRYWVDDSNLIDGSLLWNINTQWSVGVYGSYEHEDRQLEEVGGWIERKLDCIAYRIYLTYEPGYMRYDGIEEDDDFKISFVLWLTDFSPPGLREFNDR